MEVQYWNVAGSLLGVFLSALCITKGASSRLVFFTGFLILAIDSAWFTYTFLSGYNASDDLSALVSSGSRTRLAFYSACILLNCRNAGTVCFQCNRSRNRHKILDHSNRLCVDAESDAFFNAKTFRFFKLGICKHKPDFRVAMEPDFWKYHFETSG